VVLSRQRNSLKLRRDLQLAQDRANPGRIAAPETVNLSVVVVARSPQTNC
jgi:hypothetical protein